MVPEEGGQAETAAVIEARGLEKWYGPGPEDTQGYAVRGIDFTVEAGRCFALLGPNGAGKSSTIRMISCLTPLSRGMLRVFGMDAHPDAREIKRRIGVVAQDDFLDPDLTVEENLVLHGLFYGQNRTAARRRAADLAASLGLADRLGSAVRALSGGLRRRLVIARALMGHPDLLVLDEPTTGLDPQARLVVWAALRALLREGVTLVVTTHYMEEAERLADELVVMDHGRILDQGAPHDLIRRVAGQDVVEVFDVAVPRVVDAVGDLGRVEARGDACAVLTDDPARVVERLRRELGAGRYLVRPADLEDVFLLLTGKELGE
jgi:lipooligosaccharide transport system ATP-binding protein